MAYTGSGLEGELSLASAARVIGVDRHTVSRWLKRGVFQRWRRAASGRPYIPVGEVRRVRDSRVEMHDAVAAEAQEQSRADLRRKLLGL